ncbi:fibrinogen-like protein 1 [Haliotis rufescens]|uniref:fibrinogen-like protein 1 n=1 Tax=Haliotis rufescens TaxID=6454 RepID=UPI00201EBE15|nr:fibrinogen-like protein 1 [Haliotis rufescens]
MMHVLYLPQITGIFMFKAELCSATSVLATTDTDTGIQCAALCLQNPQCRTFDRNGRNCTLFPQPDNDQCKREQFSSYFVERGECQNGGYKGTGNSCVCVHGYVGDNCERRMASCSEGFKSGSYVNFKGVLPVQPSTSNHTFFVLCDMSKGGRLYVQYREHSSTDMFRPWSEYTGGFGTLTGDHWLGNRHLYALLSFKNMTFTISYVIKDGTAYSQRYTSFKILDEDNNFAIDSFDQTSGDFGIDCLTGVIRQPFSAKDRDNDDLSWWTCALEHQSGWWFKSCDVIAYSYAGIPTLCNPNGRLTPTSDGLRQNVPGEVFWDGFPYSVYSTYIWLTDSP